MQPQIAIVAALAAFGVLGCGGAGVTADTTSPSTADDAGTSDEAGASGAAGEARSTWAAGGTIPSGRAGVAPVEILTVHKNGSGEVCGTGRTATLKYKAMKISGEVLDPGTRPFSFRVGSGEAIAGWDVIVAKMRVGDSFTVKVPKELAYGPAKGDLEFDMELQSVR